MSAQYYVFGILLLALGLFAWGRIRHDVVALLCLMLLVLSGTVAPSDAFLGFGHPAVITVAVVLVVSRGLQNSGLVDWMASGMERLGAFPGLQVMLLCALVALASAFMNNIGALAILMPVGIHLAVKSGRSPSRYLMPLAFASLLGGTMTLIGTPPNIIMSSFRQEHLGAGYDLFAYSPVGVGITLGGLLLLGLIAGRLLPSRPHTASGGRRFEIEAYLTEVEVGKGSRILGMTLDEVQQRFAPDVQFLNIIRNQQLFHAPGHALRLLEGDILTLQADSADLRAFVDRARVQLVGKAAEQDLADSGTIALAEAVVMAESAIQHHSASSLRLRDRYGLNLLAISRKGQQLRRRIDHVRFQPGDVLLLQGEASILDETLSGLGCLPLADRGFAVEKPRRILLALGIFVACIALVISLRVPIEMAFALAAMTMVFAGLLKPSEVYTSIDWPVIVLLAALLPMGRALESSGGAQQLAEGLLHLSILLSPSMTLSLLFVLTMLLSNLINNAATVVLMAPIGLSVAQGLGVSPDPFLMGIAVASSSAFMTPIGHQSNTLVMGPGGYRFTDYTRLGLPLSLLVSGLAIPLILHFWPL
jgi:di/tricarboxylate transporter